MIKNEFRVEGDIVWIKLTQGKETCIDLSDWPSVQKYKWCAHKGGNTFYAKRTGEQKLHNFLLLQAKMVDHKDGDGLNNRRSNLRACDRRTNRLNSAGWKTGSSRFKGVNWKRPNNKWWARITIRQVTKDLGLFDMEEDAARAYDEAAKKDFGEFARLNFPCHLQPQFSMMEDKV